MSDSLEKTAEAFDLLVQAIQECEFRASEFRTRVEADQKGMRSEQDFTELEDALSRRELDYAELKDQLSGIEQELCEEKERSENLNELANERREEITRVTEQYEEAQERYEEAKWLLGKASHFERLVKRRRKLIDNLISTIRARQKANVALKAGMDGLRKYKATAEGKQQELLGRIEKLEISLKEAEEQILKPADGEERRAMADTSTLSQISDLKNQVAAHENTIKGLREELRHARVIESENAVKSREIERLNENLVSKNAVIAKLRENVQDQEHATTRLQEFETETVFLKSTAEADQQRIAELEREVGELRVAIAEHAQGSTGRPDAEFSALQARLREQEESLERMSESMRQYEGTIATLSEAVDHWKRKYDFLNADAPYQYDSASGGTPGSA